MSTLAQLHDLLDGHHFDGYDLVGGFDFGEHYFAVSALSEDFALFKILNRVFRS
jgi:hypothetical protein